MYTLTLPVDRSNTTQFSRELKMERLGKWQLACSVMMTMVFVGCDGDEAQGKINWFHQESRISKGSVLTLGRGYRCSLLFVQLLALSGRRPAALRGGGASGLPRKRFAWELDCESLANDYTWEGAPVWGEREEQLRLERAESRRRRLNLEFEEECEQSGVSTQDYFLLQTIPKLADSRAEDNSEANKDAAKSLLAQAESELDGVGWGKHALHDPDQFSLWSKGWMGRDTASQQVPQWHSKRSDWDMETSSSDSRHDVMASPGQPVLDGSCLHTEGADHSHTGLALGDRMVALALLVYSSSAPLNLGVFGLSWAVFTSLPLCNHQPSAAIMPHACSICRNHAPRVLPPCVRRMGLATM